MKWLNKNSKALSALAAIVTALTAILALVAVRYQLQATDAVQRAQSARDAYRSHLALSSTLPKFANPSSACALINGSSSGAYTAFVDHLLYSAEQMTSVERGWQATFLEALEPHAPYLCSKHAPPAGTPGLATLLENFKNENCTKVSACQ